MTIRQNNCTPLFLVSAASFGGAAGMYLVQAFLAAGVFKSICETTLYILIAGATLVLSYALFIRASQNQGSRAVHLRG